MKRVEKEDRAKEVHMVGRKGLRAATGSAEVCFRKVWKLKDREALYYKIRYKGMMRAYPENYY